MLQHMLCEWASLRCAYCLQCDQKEGTGEGITPWNPEDASTVCGSGGQFILQLKLTGMMSSGVTEAPIVL